MNDVYKIMGELDKTKKAFCLQSQGHMEYYMMSVEDIYGKKQYLRGETLEEVETQLKIIWGHLLESKPAIPTGMPVPAGFPIP